MQRLITTYSRLEWSSDGTAVTKSRSASLDSRRRFRNELRVNQLLLDEVPPIRTPRLLGFGRAGRELTFQAVDGSTCGPKYPDTLSTQTIDAIVELVRALRNFNPRRRWLRRMNVDRRLQLAVRFGLLSSAECRSLIQLNTSLRISLRFAHGDLTARNVIHDGEGPVLIDWEWAGLYPPDYDLAFLWFSLLNVDGGRTRVEQHLPGDRRSFLMSALVIELWHLQWFVKPDFRPRHLATRDLLLDRLRS